MRKPYSWEQQQFHFKMENDSGFSVALILFAFLLFTKKETFEKALAYAVLAAQ
jgi:hypothetical protein